MVYFTFELLRSNCQGNIDTLHQKIPIFSIELPSDIARDGDEIFEAEVIST